MACGHLVEEVEDGDELQHVSHVVRTQPADNVSTGIRVGWSATVSPAAAPWLVGQCLVPSGVPRVECLCRQLLPLEVLVHLHHVPATHPPTNQHRSEPAASGNRSRVQGCKGGTDLFLSRSRLSTLQLTALSSDSSCFCFLAFRQAPRQGQTRGLLPSQSLRHGPVAANPLVRTSMMLRMRPLMSACFFSQLSCTPSSRDWHHQQQQ